VNIGCQIQGNGKLLLLLHGWSFGISKERYQPLIDELSKYYRVIAIDFPGFGKSDLPNEPWGVIDYSRWLSDFLIKNKLQPEIILGHSFGGRVAIKGVAFKLLNPKKVILVASAGIERKGIVIRAIRFLSAIVPGFIKKRLNFGSKDYRESLGVMRESMKLVVGESLEKDMLNIKTPCLLIWGNEDATTPLWHGKLMNKLLSNSELKIIDGANHGLAYKEVDKVTNLIIKWDK